MNLIEPVPGPKHFSLPLNILLVDDEKSILNALGRLVADLPVQVLTAQSGAEALQYFKNTPIAVVISDNRMPAMQGVDLLSRIKEISPDTVRILLTGFADLPTAIAAINLGEVFRFLVKPWDNEQVIEVISEAANRYRLLQSLKKSDEATLLSLAQTIELKDPYTRGHCDNVALYALAIADELNLPGRLCDQIRHGSWLHDCGKIGVPGVILNKNGKLTDEEFAIVKKHPQWGADVARQAMLDERIINIILYHHERLDGQGYPAGLASDKIPLEARIVAVADVFDAITTDRAYRKAFDLEKGCEILQSLKGKHLDEKLVDILIDKVKSGTLPRIHAKRNRD